MNTINCLENGSEHRYGLWNEINDGKEGCKTCEKCGFQRVLPMTENIAKQIKMQKEAIIFFNAFQKLDKNDTYMLGYLYTILEDYINYLSSDKKSTLLTIMDSVAKSDSINYQNAAFIHQLSASLKDNFTDEFYDTFDEFKNFNSELFESILNVNEINNYHR